MKTIGLIGGMSWESSLEYYRMLNELTKERLGGFSSSKCILHSLDFAEIESLQHKNKWKELNKIMAKAAKDLYKGGADIILLCTNTMHLCSEAIREAIPIPFLHITEAVGLAISALNIKKVGLMGTKFTMEKNFYARKLKDDFDIETITPDEDERDQIHKIIYEELVHGKLLDTSRLVYKQIIQNLKAKGAEGVVLACTEIPLLIKPDDADIPLFDTSRIHAEKAVEWALTSND